MNICFIGKYPPIQGGVSMHGYWTARGLAQRGHKVFVVTNANEVEPDFRIHLTAADKAPGGEYARDFPQTSGFVRVHSTEPPDYASGTMFYIPQNNPTVTRLASIATDLIHAEDCQVIFSYYLEPYGLAAHMASLWTGVPYLFKHAGSDLHRLALRDDLRTAYVEVLHRANRIISSGPSREQILSYGVPKERITPSISFELPNQYFRPDGPPLDINSVLAELRASNLVKQSEQSLAPIDTSLPILGIYGKLGVFKGSFDLLRAAARLIHSGFPFYLVALSNGWREPHFRHLIDELKIAEHVRLLPFLPHWRVPEFIRACTAVAFLERDFPIAVHGPTIPSEVLACGKCLLVSAEIAHKQRFRTRIRNLKNLVIVPDPKQHDVLADCVRYALEDRRRAEEIGGRGFEEIGVNHNHERYITRMESLITEVAAEAPVAKRVSEESEAQDSVDLTELTKRYFPCTYTLLDDEHRERLGTALARSALAGGRDENGELPLRLGRELLSFFEHASDETDPSVKEVCRYEYELQDWERNKSLNERPKPALQSPSFEESSDLYVSVQGAHKLVEFDYDVELIIEAVKSGEDLPGAARRQTKILFHSSNVPMKVNDSTEHLIGLIAGGPRTVRDLFQILCEHYGCGDELARTQLKESYLSVLEALYWAGVLELSLAPFWAQNGVVAQESGERSSL
jgi:glycosyltransferase involved in cell wall biosynthesis